MQDAVNDDPEALHLWRIKTNEDNRLYPDRIQPDAIEHEEPTLIILPGLSVNHSWADGGDEARIGGHVKLYMDMFGNIDAVKGIQTIAITYPDYKSDPDMIRAIAKNSRGPADKPYSLIAEKLADALLGQVENYSALSSDSEKHRAVEALQKRLGTKVIAGFSMGSLVAEGVQNAIVERLEKLGFPTEEIVPYLKMVVSGDIAIQKRHEGDESSCATVLHVVNHRDYIHVRNMESDDILEEVMSGMHPSLHIGRGTTLTKINNNEAILMVSIPTNTDTLGGHNIDYYFRPMTPDSGEVTKNEGLLSYTEVTGHIPGNTLRGMMQKAIEMGQAAKSCHELPLLPDIISLASTPNPYLGAGRPVYPMSETGYSRIITGIIPLLGKAWGIRDILEGGPAIFTRMAREALDIVDRYPWERKALARKTYFRLDINAFAAGRNDSAYAELKAALRFLATEFTEKGDAIIVSIMPPLISQMEPEARQRMDREELSRAARLAHPIIEAQERMREDWWRQRILRETDTEDHENGPPTPGGR